MTDPSPPPDRSAILEHARAALALRIRAGYESLDDVITVTLESVTDDVAVDEPEELAAAVRAIAVEQVARLRAERSTWPATTDNDRLERAFAALEAAGIVARENFTCCQNCGHTEIEDEIEATRSAGRAVRGYTFFHQQDTERAADGDGVLLAYGVAGKDVEAVEIGREVAGALRAAGLSVSWSGEVSRRIGVSMEWRKSKRGLP